MIHRFVFSAVYLSFPGLLSAQEKAVDQAAVDPFASAYLLKLTIGLILVVVVIFLLAWMMRKMNLTQHGKSGLIKIVAGLAVGSRDRIVLLQVGDEQLLLGLSPGRIEKLHTLQKTLQVNQESQAESSFANKLSKIIDKSRS